MLCLGNEYSVDLKAVIRRYPGDMEKLKNTIVEAMDIKPERHYFYDDDKLQVFRLMNMTGGNHLLNFFACGYRLIFLSTFL